MLRIMLRPARTKIIAKNPHLDVSIYYEFVIFLTWVVVTFPPWWLWWETGHLPWSSSCSCLRDTSCLEKLEISHRERQQASAAAWHRWTDELFRWNNQWNQLIHPIVLISNTSLGCLLKSVSKAASKIYSQYFLIIHSWCSWLVRKPVPQDCSYYCHIKSWITVNTFIIKHLAQPGLVITIPLEISVAHPDLFHLSWDYFKYEILIFEEP